MLANADAYLSNQVGGTGHLRVTVSPANVKVDFVRAWLPADTLTGVHRNAEVAFSYTINSRITTEVKQSIEENKFSIYPNPANDKLIIQEPTDSENFQVRLISVLGQQILQSEEKQIDISQIPNGIYLVNIRTDMTEFNERIVINHNY
jgi:hypothetical protein